MAKRTLSKTLKTFMDGNEGLAKKYKCKISMSHTSGLGIKSKEVVLADHREQKKGGKGG